MVFWEFVNSSERRDILLIKSIITSLLAADARPVQRPGVTCNLIVAVPRGIVKFINRDLVIVTRPKNEWNQAAAIIYH